MVFKPYTRSRALFQAFIGEIFLFWYVSKRFGEIRLSKSELQFPPTPDFLF